MLSFLVLPPFVLVQVPALDVSEFYAHLQARFLGGGARDPGGAAPLGLRAEIPSRFCEA